MPLILIDLMSGRTPEQRRVVGEVVREAMVRTLGVPADDRFQVISEHREGELVIDPSYLGIARTKDCVVIQVTLDHGRPVEPKRAFYRAVADALHARLGVKHEDVLVNLVEVVKEYWSFGNGEAQYADRV